MSYRVLSVLLISALAFFGCRTTEDGSEVAAVGPAVQPTGNVVDPSGICTSDVNEYGFASACDCAANYRYNLVIGKCTSVNRVCTQAIVQMFNPNTGKCFAATNGCVAGDLGSAGWRTKAAGDQCLIPPPSVTSKQVAGFDFIGFKILDRLPPNFACAQVATPESDACLNAGGDTTYAKGCAILCNQHIAKKGRVAGYDFKGHRSAPGLPANGACPQIANAETDACLKITGTTTYDKACKTLCNRPIALKGKVAGFNFTGFKIHPALPQNMACAQVANAETDACINLNGKTSYIKGCGVVCDVPIAK